MLKPMVGDISLISFFNIDRTIVVLPELSSPSIKTLTSLSLSFCFLMIDSRPIAF